MYIIKCDEVIKHECETLTLAIEFAKTISRFVVISGNGSEIVGVFGSRVLPIEDYLWKKRR